MKVYKKFLERGYRVEVTQDDIEYTWSNHDTSDHEMVVIKFDIEDEKVSIRFYHVDEELSFDMMSLIVEQIKEIENGEL